MTGLMHEDLTYQLRGLIFDVRNELAAGWSEEVYHQALLQAIQGVGIPVQSKTRRALMHRGVEIHVFEPDLLVADTIILELKALPYQKHFLGEQYAQVIHYLKFFQKELGLLVNFGTMPVAIKRVAWSEPILNVLDDLNQNQHISATDKREIYKVCHHIVSIAREVGLGYSDQIYRKLVAIELRYQGLACVTEIEVPAKWRDAIIGRYQSDCVLVENRYVLHIRSLIDQPSVYDFARVETYLRSLDLPAGLICNFGRKQLQLHGIARKNQ